MHLSFHYFTFIHKCIHSSITLNLSFHYCTIKHLCIYPAITAYLVIQVFILPLMHIYAFFFHFYKQSFSCMHQTITTLPFILPIQHIHSFFHSSYLPRCSHSYTHPPFTTYSGNSGLHTHFIHSCKFRNVVSWVNSNFSSSIQCVV